MKIYFDESGQSGCVLQKNDLLNFDKQPTFAIGAVVVRTDREAERLTEKYRLFKEKFGVEGEIKGSDLLTRKRNEELEYILRNILDRFHFFVLLYDKRFYVSTLLLLSLWGFEYQRVLPGHFYHQATLLSQQKDDFFIRYLKYIENPNFESFSEYLKYLTTYAYINFGDDENAVVTMAKGILEEDIVDKCYDDFLTFGSYENPKITNLINLTALSELIYFIKTQVDVGNEDIVYVHDHIKEYETTIRSELSAYGINVIFSDSKQEEMLQIADNVVSILRHAYDRGIEHIRAKEMWDTQSEWDMSLLSWVMRKLSNRHINFTVPISDWAAALCVEGMFNPRFPKKYRNNFYFNYYYQEELKKIFMILSQTKSTQEEIMKLLEK